MNKASISAEASVSASQNIKERDYWLQKLSGEWQRGSFPGQRSGEKNIINTLAFEVPEETLSRLLKIVKGSDTRLHMVMVTAVTILLDRYHHAGGRDVIVGVPIYKQETGQKEMFVNTVLPLRNSWQEETTFKELLLQVRQTLTEAVAHQNYPMETLFYHLDIPYEEGGPFPLFDTAVLLENIHNKDYLQHIGVNMLFLFNRNGGSLEARVEYNASLYQDTTVEGIATHFIQLLGGALFNVDTPLEQVDVLVDEEKQQLLETLNNTDTAYDKGKTIPGLFAEQVEKSGDRCAVVSGRWHITYRELDRRANQLACMLQEKGVGPDSIVAIMVERSIEMMVGIMGILKAGGAYLPIDPDYPQDRIDYMLKESNAEILLTSDDLAGAMNCAPPTPVHLFTPDTGQLAYIIYTSGSTGKPKGVMLEHGSVHNLLLGLRNRIYGKYNRTLNIALVAPIAFDASVKQVFAALLQGHALHIVPEEIRRDGGRLLQFYNTCGIDISDGTPTLLELLLQYGDQGRDTGVTEFLIGGEALKHKTAANFLDRFNRGEPSITNVYGPTECCVDATCFGFNRETAVPGDTVPIGKPLPNVKVFIVGRDNRLLPMGAAGELCIAGDGVARGYLNKPELTAQRFIDFNRFHRSPLPCKTDKTYKTGDLAKWLPDGNIQFLGRIDHQVSIRGNRIELEEIENRLLTHTAVKEAVVMVREDSTGDKYLCAYVIPSTPGDGEEMSGLTEHLREYLARCLPDYMLPAHYVQLESFPVNANGKTDRRKLPEPKVTAGDSFTPPANETEERLAVIWSEILGLDKEVIGTNANFFDIGGHSLRATIMTARIHRELNVRLPLIEIFKTPTIKALSGIIKGSAPEGYRPLARVEERDHYPLTTQQRRLFFLQHREPRDTGYNIPTVVQLEGAVDHQKMEHIFRQLIHRHESLRTAFKVVNNEPVQEIHDEVDFRLDRLEADEAEAKELVEKYLSPLDLTQAPLFRAGLMKLAQDRYLLMIIMHHIITDGTSIGIMMKEFMALANGNKLPELKVRYRDYANWQNSPEQTALRNKQETYWQERFREKVVPLELPCDYPRPPLKSWEGNRVIFLMERNVIESLKVLAAEEDATLFMVMLAIYTVLLYKLTGQQDIVVGTPVAARDHDDLLPLVGMFVNNLCLRNYPTGDKTFREFLREVKKNTLADFENRDYRYGELVKLVEAETDQGRNPLFDTVFVLQNMEIPVITIPGLTMTPYDYLGNASRFDLGFIAQEGSSGCSVIVEYSTRLFKDETIGMFIDNFHQLVSGVLENKHTELKDIVIRHGLSVTRSAVSQLDFGFEIDV